MIKKFIISLFLFNVYLTKKKYSFCNNLESHLDLNSLPKLQYIESKKYIISFF